MTLLFDKPQCHMCQITRARCRKEIKTLYECLKRLHTPEHIMYHDLGLMMSSCNYSPVGDRCPLILG